MSVVLTLLYAPGSRPDRARKAFASDADMVVLDLEDAVPPATKDTARAEVAALIAEQPERPVQVRINALGTPWCDRDLAMVAGLPPQVGVRLPKVGLTSEISRVLDIAGPRPVHCLLESAAGIERAGELAAAPYVASIALGEADLRSDLGVRDPAALDWCRQRIVVAARAAGLPPPMMSAYLKLTDEQGLADTCREGARIGFLGRSAIHPKQIPTILAAFEPEPDQVARAREILDVMEKATEATRGTAVLGDGSFVDVALVEGARRTVELAARYR